MYKTSDLRNSWEAENPPRRVIREKEENRYAMKLM